MAFNHDSIIINNAIEEDASLTARWHRIRDKLGTSVSGASTTYLQTEVVIAFNASTQFFWNLATLGDRASQSLTDARRSFKQTLGNAKFDTSGTCKSDKTF